MRAENYPMPPELSRLGALATNSDCDDESRYGCRPTPSAVVVARNRYIAEDALELIDVEYAALGA